MMGVAVLFAAFVERMGLDGEELFNMARSILKARTDGDVVTGNNLQVLRDFACIRLMGEQTTFY